MGSRLKGWERRLDRELRISLPFAWAASDCWLLAVRAVRAVTGIDHSLTYRYQSRRDAARIMRARGGLIGIASSVFGEPMSPTKAKRGDVVLVRAPHEMFGVCAGHVIAVQGVQGIEYVPLSRALMAWAV